MKSALSAALCLSATVLSAQDGDPVVSFEQDDKVMNAAIADAQASLPLFLCTAVNDEGYGPDGGFVKVRIPVKEKGMTHEVIWVGPFASWNGEEFVGLLANEPIALPGLHAGDQLDFHYDMIVDWAWYQGADASWGNYTTRVILEQQGDAESLDMLASFSVPAVQSDWTCDP